MVKTTKYLKKKKAEIDILCNIHILKDFKPTNMDNGEDRTQNTSLIFELECSTYWATMPDCYHKQFMLVTIALSEFIDS